LKDGRFAVDEKRKAGAKKENYRRGCKNREKPEKSPAPAGARQSPKTASSLLW